MLEWIFEALSLSHFPLIIRPCSHTTRKKAKKIAQFIKLMKLKIFAEKAKTNNGLKMGKVFLFFLMWLGWCFAFVFCFFLLISSLHSSWPLKVKHLIRTQGKKSCVHEKISTEPSTVSTRKASARSHYFTQQIWFRAQSLPIPNELLIRHFFSVFFSECRFFSSSLLSLEILKWQFYVLFSPVFLGRFCNVKAIWFTFCFLLFFLSILNYISYIINAIIRSSLLPSRHFCFGLRHIYSWWNKFHSVQCLNWINLNIGNFSHEKEKLLCIKLQRCLLFNFIDARYFAVTAQIIKTAK